MDDRKKQIRDVYGKIADRGPAAPGCCGPESPAPPAEAASKKMGYSDAEVTRVPEGANLGLGCGNPQAIAALQPGETVLDLGAGAGFDCFLAARQVGESGAVIGVDMTPEMVDRARENAAKAGAENVEFRLGEIERLPVADASVDVILSNCVINLSSDKRAVYREAFRVLRPGGRLAISDVVARTELPDSLKSDLAMHTGCVAGAVTIAETERILADAGFEAIRIRPKEESRDLIRDWSPGRVLEDHVVSAAIEASKPRT
jgi:SAM-dependent methyltransferase